MKKGMVLINVIAVMILLNMIVLSAFMMNVNISKTRSASVRNREKEIYTDSKLQTVDYVIKKLFKNSLIQLSENISLIDDEKKISEVLAVYMRNKLWYIGDRDNLGALSNEISIRINGFVYSDYMKHSFEVEYKDIISYNDIELRYVSYTIGMPFLSDDDIDEIKNADIDNVYGRYKDSLILNKIIY